MRTGDYSPFDKPIGELDTSDLAALKSVNEGWYVEYKRECPTASHLGKTISSFANTYGGWLFLGVEELSKQDNCAGAFPGIANADLEAVQQRIRQGASQHVTPTPYFEMAVLSGPCVEIGLAEDKSVVVVEVDHSNSAPHVHKDARIYRRAGDSSEPRPETDRHLLEQLWQRSKEVRRTLRQWTRRDPEFSKGEAENPYLRLMFCVDPWLQRSHRIDAGFSEVRDILTREESDGISLVFDSVSPAPGGALGRQMMGNNPRDFGLTCRLSFDLRCDFFIPIRVFRDVNLDVLGELLHGYVHGDRFIEILRSAGHETPDVMDLNLLIFVLIATVRKYRRLVRLLAGSDQRLFLKARALNLWRVVSFIDVDECITDFDRYGIPVAMNKNVTWPSGDAPDSFFELSDPKLKASLPAGPDREAVESAGQGWLLFALLAPMFGCSGLTIESESGGDDNGYPALVSFEKLYAAGERARNMQGHLQPPHQ